MDDRPAERRDGGVRAAGVPGLHAVIVPGLGKPVHGRRGPARRGPRRVFDGVPQQAVAHHPRGQRQHDHGRQGFFQKNRHDFPFLDAPAAFSGLSSGDPFSTRSGERRKHADAIPSRTTK
jgi:hypothetical protein